MTRTVDICKCRIVRDRSITYDSVNDFADANNVLRLLGYADSSEEYFILLCLDVRGGLVGIHELSHGDIAHTIVSVRSVFQRALLNNAAAIIVAHNHPSGNAEPSDEDIIVTRHLVEAGKLMEVPVLDHIILAADDYTSLQIEGLM